MNLHLVRMNLNREELIRFAQYHNLLRSRDDDFGYVLHAWLKSMFAEASPKPFYFDTRHAVCYGYCTTDAETLAENARAFADPLAHRVLAQDSLAGKPMPPKWPIGKRLELHVRACPITRKGDTEKDAFLRALDQWVEKGEDPAEKPVRAQIYREWFEKQIDPGILILEHVSVEGMRARGARLRRSRASNPSGLRTIERPEAHFRAVVTIRNSEEFTRMLIRGIGRHRSFGFGMIRLMPAT
ncbi:type I-E CRISPR-associated protein Cas6/Cse3/CasE [Desulfatirhabdium butyrativorans]|uniref:type I-E CRISPR-associated protein Cas6/Cse3/CasE n=1 Tax=Desulfatirhabdium butyrativorans TaxID=340467 RepID=UPI0004239697|nr:type I-E CRISPR-associated protein Cas6/Cse3/CasE [Desulfatirhabdium butyrativorans]